ncbi:MAG: hypothetical protein HYZ93_06615, partial [Candidatus Omnitrophica bacterium]|nr:hypothetical protein [Candidatus Omnitrophota bacterium]
MKVLIIELSNLGDAILTYPALSALWAAYPGAEFHLLASGRTRELFQGEPRIHRVWAWESQAPPWIQLALVARLAGLGFSRVVDFRNSIIPLFIWGARRTPILRGPSPDGIHRADLHLRLVASLGVPPAPAAVRLPFGPQE